MRSECAKKESAVLKRLGPVPFWRGERKCLDALGEMYSRAMESASRCLLAVDRSGDCESQPRQSAEVIVG